jgi:peptidoglycan/LPS O-acetylase OafA/YrhL
MPLYVSVSMALSLTAGILSWHLVERWFLPRRVAERTDPPAKSTSGYFGPAFSWNWLRQPR